MNEKIKDPLAHSPRRNLFADGTTVPIGKPGSVSKKGDGLYAWSEPLDGSIDAGDVVIAPRVLSDRELGEVTGLIEGALSRLPIVQPQSPKRGRRRPKAEAGYPGPE